MYRCNKHMSIYDTSREPHIQRIRTEYLDPVVWADCCRVFERLRLIQDVLERSIEQSLQNMLEDTRGREMIDALQQELAFALAERNKHPEGSYYYNLINQDVIQKEQKLRKCEEEFAHSQDVLKLSGIYRTSIMGFLDFLNTMQGRYNEATFQKKRNALEVLGVRVYASRDTTIRPEWPVIETPQEWLTVSEVSKLTNIHENTLRSAINGGRLKAEHKAISHTVIHRDEIARFFTRERQVARLAKYDDEWFTVYRLTATVGISNHQDIHEAIERGELKAETHDFMQATIHRDELNRFLQASPIRLRELMESIQPDIKIMYSPLFTGVQASEDAQQVVNVVHNAGLAKLVARLTPLIVVKG